MYLKNFSVNCELRLYNQGYGGTTTTAETARKVYRSRALRDRLVSLCPPQYQSAMAQILLNDLTILTIMSCDKILIVSKVGKCLNILTILSGPFDNYPRSSWTTILHYLRQLSWAITEVILDTYFELP